MERRSVQRRGRLLRRTLAPILVAAGLAAVACAPALAAQLDVFVTNEETQGVGANGPGNLAAYAVGSTGALTALGGSPYAVATGSGDSAFPAGSALTPDGQFLFVPDGNGSIDSYTVGDGGLTPLAQTTVGSGTLETGVPGISPDGRFLYELNYEGSSISAFAIGADGSLTALPGSPYATPFNPESMAIAPDGKSLYVADFTAPSELEAFSIAADGVPSAIPGATYTLGDYTNGLAITPGGGTLYATNQDDSFPISAFAIDSDGTLSTQARPAWSLASDFPDSPPVLSPSGTRLYIGSEDGQIVPYAVGGDGTLTPSGASVSGPYATPLWALGFTPDGDHLYGLYTPDSNEEGALVSWDVTSGGALTAVPGSIDTGGIRTYQPTLTVSSDPGPVAAISATPATSGSPSSFSAAASHATISQYGALTYDWSFGDGTSATDAGPSPTHVYANPGTYRATVTVVDGAGCSTALQWTGITAYCWGDPDATASATVTVTKSGSASQPPAITHLRQSHVRWRVRTSSSARGRSPVGTKFTFRCSETAKLTLSFDRGSRRAGTLSRRAHAGGNTVSFDGVFSKRHRLAPGRYTLTITAVNAAGQRSRPAQISFTVVK